MRIAFAGLLLATTCCAPVWAAEFSPASKIDAVTVFLQGADVERLVVVDLPVGDHSIILKDLPANLDQRSIRVEGTGNGPLAIASVDTRSVYTGTAEIDKARISLEQQISALQTERAALDMTMADANHQRAFLLSLADKQLTPQSTTETLKGIDVTQLGGLIDLVGQRLGGLAKDIQQAQARQKDIDENVNDLLMRTQQLAPGNEYRTEVVVHVEAQKAMSGTLRVSYRVNEASWSPYYDARLTIDKASKLELVRRADVMQSTGENWNDVELTLSTARPSGQTAAPDLTEEEIAFAEELEKKKEALRRDKTIAESDDGLADMEQQISGKLDVAKPVAAPEVNDIAQKQAAIELAGFQANYVIASRVNVDNSGTSKKVRISSNAYDTALEAVTVPRLDGNAYLTAKFEIKGEGPQMPGAVNLYRDGIFVGQGYLPLLNPKEEAKLGFGVDDLIKVTRSEVKRLTGEEGIITSSNVDERSWDIVVKNLHDIAMPVTVVDRVPFATNSDIGVEEMPGMTAPASRNVDKKRGVMAWAFTLEPSAENTIKTGYKITWPEGMRVGMLD